jgi:hypothetical protein
LPKLKRQGEGSPVRMAVSKPEDLESVEILARIKIEN